MIKITTQNSKNMDVSFWDYLFKPFIVIKKKRTAFTLWVLSTIIAGNFGLVFNIIIRGNMNGLPPSASLNEDLKVGSLFLFSIVLLASSFGSVLIDFVSKNDKEFTKPKVIWLFLTVVIWLLCGVEYASFMSSQLPPIKNNASSNVWQVIFFIVSVVLSIYAYCLVIMEAKDPDFKSISDNYEDIEERSIGQITKKQELLTEDGEEIKL